MSAQPLGIVPPDERRATRRHGPTWNSIGVFIGSVFSVLVLAFLLGLGFAVVEARKEIDFLRLRVDNLKSELAYLRGRLDERKEAP